MHRELEASKSPSGLTILATYSPQLSQG